eukprot:TRINITY_DN35_c0_g3_i1.p1 TRINITY_DN35_c0_g3~~TRINITY_DN35_c0_g3_i1.p1  ORF type:complete len:351 (+),score=52.33 TRINITY_DN35_c0_g3_i1:177-1229(+)
MCNMVVRATVTLAFLALTLAIPLTTNTTRSWNLRSGPSGCTTGDTTFDYLLLVAQWPATQRSAHWPAGSDVTDFTLHGLWPSRIGTNVNSYPCTCTPEAFSESKVPASLTDMKAHWPSYTGKNDQFWGHEWSKHGTCCDKTQGLSDQASFFAGALKLRDQAGFLAALTKAGLTPGGTYSYSNMSDAIKAANGVAPLMGCKTGNTLSEVGMCVDPKTMKFMECDDTVKHQIGDEVSDCDQSIPVKFPSSSGPSPSPPGPPSSGTCKAYGCGKFIAGNPCQCNDGCAKYDECCPDFATTCGGPSPPPSSCLPGRKGPTCTSDADCTSVTGCVRCAGSGYCTCAKLSTGQCAK